MISRKPAEKLPIHHRPKFVVKLFEKANTAKTPLIRT